MGKYRSILLPQWLPQRGSEVFEKGLDIKKTILDTRNDKVFQFYNLYTANTVIINTSDGDQEDFDLGNGIDNFELRFIFGEEDNSFSDQEFIVMFAAKDGTLTLRKTIPDGDNVYFLMPESRLENLPGVKISELFGKYKISGAVNKDGELVNISKVELVDASEVVTTSGKLWYMPEEGTLRSTTGYVEMTNCGYFDDSICYTYRFFGYTTNGEVLDGLFPLKTNQSYTYKFKAKVVSNTFDPKVGKDHVISEVVEIVELTLD